ncbi:MAG: hypothetical protein M3Z08_16425, partial [Chloroflexota bacterium]|nr:hypothetical protein [Chloroflexota bacterium]
AWLYGITAGHIPMASAHGCAPPVPPAVPGSPAPVPARAGVIFLNEVLLAPVSTWDCAESGTSSMPSDSWVEFYNPQSQPFDLYKAHAGLDSGSNTSISYLPFGASIPAHGFLVVFPFRDPALAGRKTLLLRLLITDTVIDQVTIPTLLADQSYARTSDGGGTWQVTDTPTIDASNNPAPQKGTTATSTSSKHHRSKARGRTHTTATAGSNGNTSQVNGVQPDGNTLHLPGSDTPTPDTPPVVAPKQPAATSTADMPRTIGLGALGVGLVLSLLWVWWLFKRKGI